MGGFWADIWCVGDLGRRLVSLGSRTRVNGILIEGV
jgi:hypothetical protein